MEPKYFLLNFSPQELKAHTVFSDRLSFITFPSSFTEPHGQV